MTAAPGRSTALPRNGSLSEYRLPWLLHLAWRARHTGLVRLALPVGPAEIYVRDGELTAVELPGDVDRIGQVLASTGVLDEERTQRTLLAPRAPGIRYGRLLVEGGVINEAQLLGALRLQVRRRMHRLFFVEGGAFSIEEESHARGLEAREPVRVHPYRSIYQGVRSAWSEARFGPPPEGFVRLTAPPETLAHYGFTDGDAALVRRLGKSSARASDLVAAAETPDVGRALLYVLGVTEAVTDDGAAGETHAAEGEAIPWPIAVPPPPRPMAATPPPRPIAAPSPPRPIAATPPPRAAAVSAPTATTPAAEKSSRPLPLGRPFAPPAMPLSYSAVPSRLGVPERPSSDSAVPRQILSGASGMSGLSGIAGFGGATGNATAQISPDALARVIAQKILTVETEDLFQILGVGREATKAELKVAFLSAAKTFHPDRLGAAGLASLRLDAERIFRRVSEAYSTLTDDVRRIAYLARLSAPVASSLPEVDAQRVVAAEMAFMEGEVAWKRRDYTVAIERLSHAVELHPSEGEAVALLAWVRLQAGTLPVEEAERELRRAVAQSPRCARAHYFFGMTHKQLGDVPAALASFKRAVDLDPRLLEAQSELRVLSLRTTREQGTSENKRDWRKK